MAKHGRSLEELNLNPEAAPGPEQDPRRVPARLLARAIQEMRDLGYWEYADDFLSSVQDQCMAAEAYTLRQWIKLEEIYERSRRSRAETFREFVTRR